MKANACAVVGCVNGTRQLKEWKSQLCYIRGLALAAVNLPTKFEVYLHSLRRYERWHKMSEIGCFAV